jgi:hypothetical protein
LAGAKAFDGRSPLGWLAAADVLRKSGLSEYLNLVAPDRNGASGLRTSTTWRPAERSAM